MGHSSEWFINNGDDIFFYDFTIRSLKFIVEYNGIKFHPKSEDDHNWKNIYNDTISMEYQFSKDKLKEKSAKDNGFEYHVVFSDDDLKSKQSEIIEILRKKCQ